MLFAFWGTWPLAALGLEPCHSYSSVLERELFPSFRCGEKESQGGTLSCLSLLTLCGSVPGLQAECDDGQDRSRALWLGTLPESPGLTMGGIPQNKHE